MSHVKKNILVLTSTYPRWQGDHEPGFVHELCKRCTKDFEVHVLAPHAAGCLVDEVVDNVKTALKRALVLAEPEDVVCITGSHYLAEEVLKSGEYC